VATQQIDKAKPGKAKPAPADVNEDRFNPALRAYNDNTAEARVQRRNAQMFAWASMILNGILAFGIISASHQPKLLPYVVRIDSHGTATDLGTPPRLDQSPQIEQFAVMAELRDFIEAVRSVTVDPEYQTRLIQKHVKPFLEGGLGTQYIDDYYKSNNPFDDAAKGTEITVDVDEPLPESQSTYELHWYETTKTSSGVLVGKTEWKGIATVDLHKVDADQILTNPLGIYIKNISWENVGSTQGPAAQ
jgi:type IV secretory pathway TrbF-like protein